ncbi:4-nitrophenylphosphatase [Trichosporon asahii var. asahii CBS 2479]|uniref:4-nitrophenylphosphatase n=1 Tax=Trichosporon asahii var. asahii (strain ATCC 90039 / CBS 2479 / JCM 2466 / KCTC 7840 / NBRC 103889/ NCYC 2677 / UAMH 7654) TaxID=1186058 RepID=J5Q665_TRIAS|nr:4-nitrophenylphosphatase [Trichosporon asahii var. asahii CBS 2479]EJT45683.1 4-nitrophenylphosphatase [Trichosporon asahii var. asahii CBS 2479]
MSATPSAAPSVPASAIPSQRTSPAPRHPEHIPQFPPGTDIDHLDPPFLHTKEQYQKLWDSVDTLLLDCDGVIYHGPIVVPGVKTVLQLARKQGKQIIFVTNNGTKSRRMYKKTFDKLGIEAHESEIFGSGYASAVYLSKVLKFPQDKCVYLLGEKGLEEELDSVGIKHKGGTDPADNVVLTSPPDFSSFEKDPSVGAVLCSMDFGISSGSLSSPLVFALQGKKEPTVVGKPNKPMMDAIIAEHHFDKSRALMVGDNQLTDIAFGNNSGIRTLLVLGGVTHEDQVWGPKASDIKPTYVMNSLGDFATLAE